MTKKRKIPFLFAVLAGDLLLAVWVFYLLAGSPPAASPPPRLDDEQRTAAGKRFYRGLMDLSNQAQANEPMSWSITRRELNAYLAGLDEIVALAPGGEPGAVSDLMSQAGRAEPVVALDEGEVTIMARLTEYGRVLSMDIAFEMTAQEQLRAQLGGVRIGRLPVPRALLRGRLEALKQRLQSLRQSSDRKAEGTAPRAVADAAEVLAAAIDGKPISAEGSMGGRDILITAVEIRPDGLTIEAIPQPAE